MCEPGAVVREKELRIALVCFGGVSLAVYMHGISKEILKLVRASAALHSIKDRDARLRMSFFDTVRRSSPEYDTEAIYFDVLREIGQHIDLRVIVDVIAGASAGGINGAMLGRALSYDLPILPLRDLWLDNADVNVLLAPDARAGTWSKLALRPLFWGAAKTGLLPAIRDAEVRRNLSLFVRSRWFKPPLDGVRMSELMIDAATVMGLPERPGASLLPSGHRLDLFVALTDFYGHLHPVPIHDPPVIEEREHRHVLQFHHRRSQSGVITSDFGIENIPALAFAARATSSFPGIFPPARIAEIDQILARRGTPWPSREQFLSRAFPRHVEAGIDPAHACFIDGAVLNNRPFREAIAALQERQAYRQVDRRLIYIDPHPGREPEKALRAVPSLFSMIKGSLSDLPRNQPVTDELGWVIGFNDRVRRLRGVIEDARPRVTRLITEIVATPLDWAVAAGQIRTWRERVNAQVAFRAGFTYQSYMRLKLTTVLAFVTKLIAGLCGADQRSRQHGLIAATIDAWAVQTRLISDGIETETGPDAPHPAEMFRPARFLHDFDFDYRRRRLTFMIEGQNRLYQLLEEKRFAGLDPQIVDRLKRDFYACLDTLNRRCDAGVFDEDTRHLARNIFGGDEAGASGRALPAIGAQMAERHAADLSILLDLIAGTIRLGTSTHDLDLIIAALDPAEWHHEARREVLINYLGFPYWDVLTLPITTTRQTGEFHEILVDRISSKDAHAIGRFDALADVKGAGLGSFAAFLSRSYRENDYLLGRLHAIDRLIDIIYDAAGLHGGDCVRDMIEFKKRAFAVIHQAEARHLRESEPLLAALRDAIGTFG
jgi:patatin-related protein